MEDRPETPPPVDATAGSSAGGATEPTEPDPAEPEPEAAPQGPPAADARTGDAPPPPPGGPAPEPGPASATGSWRLRRSVTDRKVKGVAGGVAAAADIDPTAVRVLFAVAGLTGFGIVAYLVLALVLQDETPDDRARPLPREQRRYLRIGLAVAAAIAAARLLDGWFLDDGEGGIGLPLLLVAAGAAVLWARRDIHSTQPQPSGPGWQPHPTGTSGGQGWQDPDDPGAPPPPPWPVAAPSAPVGSGVDWHSTGRDLLRLAAAFVAVGAFLALVAGAFLVVGVGALPMRLPFLPAAIASASLVGLVVAISRRARPATLLASGGLLVVAAVLAAGLATFPDGAGQRTITFGPGTPVSKRYEHDVGHLVLDLSRLPLPSGEARRMEAEVGAGRLSVIVPPTATTEVRAQLGAGRATLFGRERAGGDIDITTRSQGVDPAVRLDLDLKVGVGQIQVVLAEESTFGVSCRVPEDALAAPNGPVTCPHPPLLASTAMTCSVVLADPEGGAAGQGFCRRLGAPMPPTAGTFASACTVDSDTEVASCAGLSAPQVERLQAIRRSRGTPPTPVPTTAPSAANPLTCGPPDASGALTCTQAPAASTTTTIPATFRCTQDPGTTQLSCVPA